jgi:acylglycerol lipase
VHRYHSFFRLLAASPSSIHVTAYDQRGFGRTSTFPLTDTDPRFTALKETEEPIKLETHRDRKSGGWANAIPDMEWFIRRQSELATACGKKLFLYGYSMVRTAGSL